MKLISGELLASSQSASQTSCICIEIMRTDGVYVRFTNRDKAILIRNDVYLASTSEESKIVSGINDESATLTINGGFSINGLSRDDLMFGKYDNAKVTVFSVNYENMDYGVMILLSGWLNKAILKDYEYEAEFVGLEKALDTPLGKITSPGCKLSLGDANCKVDLFVTTLSTPPLCYYRARGNVTTVISNKSFKTDLTGIIDSRIRTNGFFNYGFITFTSGYNTGFSKPIKNYTLNNFDGKSDIETFLPFPYTMVIGNLFTIVAGCDKKVTTCLNKFNNKDNFDGEPNITLDKNLKRG